MNFYVAISEFPISFPKIKATNTTFGPMNFYGLNPQFWISLVICLNSRFFFSFDNGYIRWFSNHRYILVIIGNRQKDRE